MKKTKFKQNGKKIIRYQVTNDEMLRTKGTIANISRESERLGAQCNVHDNGEQGYIVELIMPKMKLNPFKKNKYNQFTNNEYER